MVDGQVRAGLLGLLHPVCATATGPVGGRDLDVGRLEVTVNNTPGVGRLYGLGDLSGDRQRVVHGNRVAHQDVGRSSPSTYSRTR